MTLNERIWTSLLAATLVVVSLATACRSGQPESDRREWSSVQTTPDPIESMLALTHELGEVDWMVQRLGGTAIAPGPADERFYVWIPPTSPAQDEIWGFARDPEPLDSLELPPPVRDNLLGQAARGAQHIMAAPVDSALFADSHYRGVAIYHFDQGILLVVQTH